ncbi:HigA family addiction module antitoxin [Bosea sp. PAMC 26642]|uniref:HigA family addiction module antitoxin n=1 Tax=Bosea sp. (strain PAMC 26642) TaxID=1792307 RepID=UPI0007704E06|nr:HigA family addiction module antitoxin [Bosea sp. PAMC 26642]AMJ62442.1 hypothetical protein AXW83_20975 [Bosea sp. PAMC 26642]
MQESKNVIRNLMDSVQTFSLRRKRLQPVRHPGAIIQSEWLKPLGLSVFEFATIWEINPYVLYEIIEGDRPVDMIVAEKLQNAFNIPMSYWMQAQYDYDYVSGNEKNR